MNPTEFTLALDLHKSKLYGFAMTLTRNRDEADDLLQETAYKAYKNIRQFKPGSNFKAWITMIMRNTFINNYRREKRKFLFEEGFVGENHAQASSVIVQNGGESNQMLEEITGLINQLNDDLKEAFLMCYAGFKYEEIAEHMDLPLGTVKSKIFYARKKLKSKVQEAYQINHFSEAMV